MPTTGGSPDAERRRELLVERAREARQLGERQRAAADACDGLLDGAAGERGEPLRARPHAVVAQHPQHRNPLRRVEVERERSLERRERQLVRAQRALQRMAAQLLDELGAADDDARLRAAEQLVAGERRRGRRRPRGSPWPTARRQVTKCHLAEDAGAEVVDEGQLVAAARLARAGASGGSSVKPTTRKFDWCTRRSSAVSAPIALS